MKTMFETFGRMIIAVVVLFVLGTNMVDTSLFSRIIIDSIILIWIFIPAFEMLMDVWKKIKLKREQNASR